MGGRSKKQTVGYRYFLGVHGGLVRGCIDFISRVRFDKRTAWEGLAKPGDQIQINRPSLFGGEKREGGVSGAIDVLGGTPDQQPNSYLIDRLGSLMPAFRGFTSLVFRQFYWGNNPYLGSRNPTFNVQRIHRRGDTGRLQWYDEKAAIVSDPGVVFIEDLAFPATQASVGPYAGVTIDDGFSPDDVLIVMKAPGLTYQAWSRWATDDHENIVEGGHPWMNDFMVTDDQDNTAQYWHDPDAEHPSEWGSPTPEDAEAAVRNRFVMLTGSSSYTFWLEDDPVHDNRGGLSIRVYKGGHVDMNPAHIVRELFTEPYGFHYPESELDENSFIAAADQLFTESMGMSWIWDRQSPVADAMDEVLRHVDGVRYVDPETGLFTLKLIRGDYDVESLLELNPSNVERVENFARPSVNELNNSLTVKYWDRGKNAPAAVNVADPALVMQQGRVSHETIEYLGFTDRNVAARAAQRDLRVLSAPLASCTVYANRDARPLRPGDVFRLDWPDYKINAVMRVTEIAYGDGKTHRIRIKCVEDVFATPETAITVPETDVYEDPALSDPQPAEHRVVQEAPYFELVRELGQRQADEELEYDPESGWLSVAAARPVEEINATIAVDAGAGFEEVGEPVDFCPSAVLDSPVDKVTTVFQIREGQDLDQVEVGQFAQVGTELVRVDGVSESTMEVGRGVLDTVPVAHNEGEAILFWGGFAGTDETVYAAQETIDVKLLTATGGQVLELDDAPTDQLVFDQRALRPYPPGNVRVNDIPLPPRITGGGPFEFEWAHRDRLQQTAGALLDHSDDSIGPEAGTSYTLEVRDENGALVRSFSGITGTSQTYSDEQVEEDVTEHGLPLSISLFSVRDALESFQRHVIPLTVAGGWGMNWGENWGGGVVSLLWTPAEIATHVWLDASAPETITLGDGDTIEQWDDQSGNDRHMLQSTLANRPVLVGNVQNGRAVARFDGSDFMQAVTASSDWTIFSNGNKHSIFVVVSSMVEGHFMATKGSSGNSVGMTLSGHSDTGSVTHHIHRGTTGGDVITNATGSGPGTDEDFFVLGVEADPNNSTAADRSLIRFNGGDSVKNNTQTASPVTSNPSTPLQIGARASSPTLQGDVGEVVVVGLEINQETRQLIEGYLAWKWGLQGDLPMAHPYKDGPPLI